MLWLRNIGLSAVLIASLTGYSFKNPDPYPYPATSHKFSGDISILTYNIKGTPWPVAWGRPDAFDQMAQHFRQLRAKGEAPSIVVLQETFTAAGREIGRRAGYRYIANGPSAQEAGAIGTFPQDNSFAAQKRWWLGETEGKYVGSGLQVLSDYPITAVRHVAFPDVACAGFDCLANKGALMVTINIPGAPTPIDIVTTHLNSRHASHAENSRSLYAFREQVSVLSRFIRNNRDPGHPLIVAGDFNVGSDPGRRQTLMSATTRNWGARAPVFNAYDAFAEQGGRLSDDAAFSRQRARDWQFFTNGSNARLTLTGIAVPFGGHRSDLMLSDHVGYTANFRLIPSPHATSSPTPSEGK